MRASGVITAEASSGVIRLGGVEFTVRVTHLRFPNGGDWAFFACPTCNSRARRLWLLDGVPQCNRCCDARHVRYRTDPMSVRQRAEVRVPKLLARLNSATPARLHPRPGRTMDRRARLENSLRLAQLTLRRHRLKGVAAALAAAKKGE
jgi:hypothetical protein